MTRIKIDVPLDQAVGYVVRLEGERGPVCGRVEDVATLGDRQLVFLDLGNRDAAVFRFPVGSTITIAVPVEIEEERP